MALAISQELARRVGWTSRRASSATPMLRTPAIRPRAGAAISPRMAWRANSVRVAPTCSGRVSQKSSGGVSFTNTQSRLRVPWKAAKALRRPPVEAEPTWRTTASGTKSVGSPIRRRR
jgi:hypothetical protein